MLVPGRANAYGGMAAVNQDSSVPRTGIYLTTKVNDCYLMCLRDSVTGKTYELAFQCRVDPKHAWIPQAQRNYIIADTPRAVRIYGILVRVR
jgi:hypothetical protein